MLTGRRAFQLPTATETLTAVLRDEPLTIAECGRKVPSEVDKIVAHCLEKDPAERFGRLAISCSRCDLQSEL
jgi:hypothetical protein